VADATAVEVVTPYSRQGFYAPSGPLHTVLDTELVEAIRAGTPRDALLSKILKCQPIFPIFTTENGLVFLPHRDRQTSALCIPDAKIKKRRVTELILDHCHQTVGHLGMQKSMEYTCNLAWWPTLTKDAVAYCQSCGKCSTIKSMNAKPQGLLHQLPVPERPWDSIAMDFLGPLPLSDGYDYLLVVICRLTSMVHLLRTTITVTAAQVALLFLNEIVRLHGLPSSIVSDRDSKFTSSFWSELHRMMGTRLLMSSAYHPQTDGATEPANCAVAQILRVFIDSDQTNWSSRLTMVEFAINSAVSATTRYSPFECDCQGLVVRISHIESPSPCSHLCNCTTPPPPHRMKRTIFLVSSPISPQNIGPHWTNKHNIHRRSMVLFLGRYWGRYQASCPLHSAGRKRKALELLMYAEHHCKRAENAQAVWTKPTLHLSLKHSTAGSSGCPRYGGNNSSRLNVYST
jgi:hypothetical protein